MARDTHLPAASGSEHTAVRGFIHRLRQIIGERSVHRFAREAGLSDSLMRKYLNGSYPGLDRLVRLAAAGGVSVQWLATGQQTGFPEIATPRAIDGQASPNEDFVRIPAFPDTGKSAPLLPAFSLAWLKREGLAPQQLVYVLVEGNAMAPTMREDDLVLVDTSQDTVTHDGAYVLHNSSGIMIKRLQFDLEGGLRVCSDNPDFKDQQLSSKAAERLDILGRVVWLGKRIK